MQESIEKPDKKPIVIIGGGPAGLTTLQLINSLRSIIGWFYNKIVDLRK